MNLRRASAADIPALVSLNREVQAMHANAFPERFKPDVPDEMVARAFLASIQAPSSLWLIAEEEEQISGFLSAEFREREESWCAASHLLCYLAGIVVAPGFRRRGIARALLENLKREAQARGVDRIELDVWACNEGARQAFTNLGFQRLMERMALRPG
jgi:ribosomal protein S18 acetylase RimI-like enzyme